MIYFVWILFCTEANLSGDCSMVKAYQAREWEDCWMHAKMYDQTLSAAPGRQYRIWCSPTEYLDVK